MPETPHTRSSGVWSPPLEFAVPGLPVGQPRHRSAVTPRGKVRHYLPTDHPVHRFKAAVALAAAEAGVELREWVAVAIEARVARPPSHFRKAGGLRKGAPPFPSKPDVDNVEKAVLDALTGIAYQDDARVVASHNDKRFTEPGEQPGCIVRLAHYLEDPAHAEG